MVGCSHCASDTSHKTSYAEHSAQDTEWDCDTENIVLLTHVSRKDGEGESWFFIDASNLTRGSLKLDSNTLNSVTIHHLQAWYMYKHDTECI